MTEKAKAKAKSDKEKAKARKLLRSSLGNKGSSQIKSLQRMKQVLLWLHFAPEVKRFVANVVVSGDRFAFLSMVSHRSKVLTG